jgi:hypothetical protein
VYTSCQTSLRVIFTVFWNGICLWFRVFLCFGIVVAVFICVFCIVSLLLLLQTYGSMECVCVWLRIGEPIAD